jgi:hypothetical protein
MDLLLKPDIRETQKLDILNELSVLRLLDIFGR